MIRILTGTKTTFNFRTTWDYFDRFDEFFNWLEKTKTKLIFINSYKTIKWNIDKYYLKELSEKGINVTNHIYRKRKKNFSSTII